MDNPNSRDSFYQLLQERIKQANPRRKLKAEGSKLVNRLKAIADSLSVETKSTAVVDLHVAYMQ